MAKTNTVIVGRTNLEIMLKVAELGLLRDNKEELARIEGYAICWATHMDGVMRINSNGIVAALYVGPGKLGEFKDITYSVLVDLYADDEDPDFIFEDYREDEFFKTYSEVLKNA